MNYLISICTAVLGFFMAVPLFALARRRPANLWLGLFVFSLSALSVAPMLVVHSRKWFGLLDWPFISIGTFYYLYVRSLTGLGNSWRQAWHFIPLAVLSIAFAWARLSMPFDDLWNWLFADGARVFGTILLVFQLVAAAYAIAVLCRLRAYRKQVRENYSSIQDRDLVWLGWLTLVVLAMLCLWFPATAFGGIWAAALCIARLLALYFIGWYGMRQHVVFLPSLAGNSAPLAEDAAGITTDDTVDISDAAADSGTDGRALEKYARSGMTDAARDLIGKRLVRRMSEERDYLDSDLKLSDLAAKIGTSPQLLSQYLNHVLGMSFFDYINDMRIAEVKRMMREEANDNRPLLDLAFAAGFNSKSTFNAAFKKIAGMAPSDWRNRYIGTSEPIG